MKEDCYTALRIPMDNPNDRKRLVLLKYLKDKTKNDYSRYTRLLNMYPENDYFEKIIIKELLSLKLIDKEITREKEQTKSGFIRAAEFNPVINNRGKLAIKNNFPSEYRKRRKEIIRGWFSFVMSIISTIVAILAIIF